MTKIFFSRTKFLPDKISPGQNFPRGKNSPGTFPRFSRILSKISENEKNVVSNLEKNTPFGTGKKVQFLRNNTNTSYKILLGKTRTKKGGIFEEISGVFGKSGGNRKKWLLCH